MTAVRDADREFLLNMNKESLVNLLLIHVRNLWSVDGLYYLGIEKRFGTAAATETDAEVWRAMGSIEAKRLKKSVGLGRDGVAGVMEALRLTGWSLDLERKEIREEGDDAVFINHDCRVQNARLSKGLSVFKCRPVRLGYLERFVEEVDPNVRVECVACPPSRLTEDEWCHWRFTSR